MPDRLGYRAKMGVVVPSTNTTMEPELYAMAPHGVTFHIARLYLAQTAIGSAEAAQAVVQAFHAALGVAVRDVLTMEPDHLLIGVSALAFMGGVAGHRRFREALQQTTTVPLTTAAEAAIAALQCYAVTRLGLLSPHPPMFDAHYSQFFRESGYEVVTLRRIDCPTTLAIATVDEATIRTALREICEARVEAIVQVGTDLVMTRLADEAERWLGLPVIAVNAAMLWQALRTRGLPDQIRGFGSLLREHRDRPQAWRRGGSLPNKALQATPYSVRSAPASGRA